MQNIPIEVWAALVCALTYFLVLFVPKLGGHRAYLVMGIASLVAVILAATGMTTRDVALIFAAIMGSGTVNGIFKVFKKSDPKDGIAPSLME